jgi:hypothetical protein
MPAVGCTERSRRREGGSRSARAAITARTVQDLWGPAYLTVQDYEWCRRTRISDTLRRPVCAHAPNPAQQEFDQ